MARKKALNKDIRVEIKKSLGRYISIFLIVALGVSFFSGLRSTESDMRYTGDAFSDASNLMDKSTIEAKVADVKKALEGTDTAAIKAATEALTTVSYEVFGKAYQAQSQGI